MASARTALRTFRCDHSLRASWMPSIPLRPLAARVVDAVDQVGVHVLAVAGGVVAHRVHHHGGVVLRHTHIERRVSRVAVRPVGILGIPVVLAEVRLRERDEHAHVVGGPQDLGEAQMGAWLAPVVVGVDGVDAPALESLHALPRAVVAGPRGPDLGVVEGQRTQEDARAVEVEVAAVDPELAEAEPDRMARVERLARCVEEREGEVVLVLRGVDVPELLWPPRLSEGEAALLEVADPEELARELRHLPAVLSDLGAQCVLGVTPQRLKLRINPDLALAHGRGDPGIAEVGELRGADEKHVAAQAAPRDRPPHGARRVAVVIREHDPLERHRHHQHAENLLAARTAHRGQVHLAGWELDLARLLPVHVHRCEGIEVLRVNRDTAPRPRSRDGDLALVPGRRDAPQLPVLPTRVRVHRLAVLLHVVGDPRPAPGHLEVPPAADGHAVAPRVGRLPTPQSVDADALARRRRLAMGFGEVPHRLDAPRQGRGRLGVAQARGGEGGNHKQKAPGESHLSFLHSGVPRIT